MIASMALFLLLTVIFRDIPPFVYYVITLLTGVMLHRYVFRGGERKPSNAPAASDRCDTTRRA